MDNGLAQDTRFTTQNTSSIPTAMSSNPKRRISDSTDETPGELHLARSRGARWFFIGLGTISLLTGIIGIVVPGLPTTIFLIIAAASYSRGSARLHRWLLTNKLLGRHVRAWYNDRSLPLRTKMIIIAIITLGTASCAGLIVSNVLIQATVVIVGIIGVWYVGLHIPTRKNTQT